MGTGGKPGLTFKMQVTSNNGNSASLSGDGVSLGVGADKETIEYFKMGASFVVSFHPAGPPNGSEPDGGSGAASAG